MLTSSIAAMRLRLLGSSQSLTFFVPPGVYQNIHDMPNRQAGSVVDSLDVVRWLLERTCTVQEQMAPLRFSQGQDFCRRKQSFFDNQDAAWEDDQREAYLTVLCQVEPLSLEMMYGTAKARAVKAMEISCPTLKEYMNKLNVCELPHPCLHIGI